MKSKAESLFHGPEGYNCAHAVHFAFSPEDSKDQTIVDEYKGYGGGRAENGTCGALYAGLKIAGIGRLKKDLEEAFVAEIGSANCREIKRECSASCRDCVGITADLLHKMQ